MNEIPDLDPCGERALAHLNRLFAEEYESWDELDRDDLIYWLRQVLLNYKLLNEFIQEKRKRTEGASMKVYVAGPYSGGDTVLNVRNAIDAADKLLKAGHVPFVPHLTMFWHLVHPHAYEVWLEYDRVWLLECDALLRLSGKSDGADREVQDAMDARTPIYYGEKGLDELINMETDK